MDWGCYIIGTRGYFKREKEVERGFHVILHFRMIYQKFKTWKSQKVSLEKNSQFIVLTIEDETTIVN